MKSDEAQTSLSHFYRLNYIRFSFKLDVYQMSGPDPIIKSTQFPTENEMLLFVYRI